MADLTELEILVNKWKKTGLLEGLSVWKQIKLAQLLNEGAKIIVNRSSDNDLLNGLTLPAITRKFHTVDGDFSVEELINTIEINLPKLEEKLIKLKELFPNTWKKYDQELESDFLNELFDLKCIHLKVNY